MKIDLNQKRTLYIGLSLIIITLIIWIAFGMEIFTKTQVIVEKTDDLFGTTYKEFEDNFILGLDYSAAISAFIGIVTGVVVFFQRKFKDS
jgi:nitrate/nitrite transporter NarK